MAYFPLWYIVWIVIGAVFIAMVVVSIYKAQIRYKQRITVVNYPTTQRPPIQVNATLSIAPIPPPLSDPVYPPPNPPRYPPPPTYNQVMNQPQYPPPYQPVGGGMSTSQHSPFRPSQIPQGQPTIEYGPGAQRKF